MTLTNDDLKAIDALLDRKLDQKLDQKLAPIQADISFLKAELGEVKTQIATINDKLDRIEKWLPLDNTYVISPLHKQAVRPGLG